MRLRLNTFSEQLKASLFFVPMMAVFGAICLGLLLLRVDGGISQSTAHLPLGLTSTVQSARVVLSTIAGATISFAGIAFSISLLILQLASSQYSPRVVHTLFREPFNKRIMALVVGTFTYCVVVLRSVRSALEDSGSPVIPNVSVAVAVVLGIATILAIVAFINHSAHTMDVSEILSRVRTNASDGVRREWTPSEPGTDVPPFSKDIGDHASIVRFDRTGWVQQIDPKRLLEALPPNTTMRLDTFPGRYAVQGTAVCTVSPPPDDRHPIDEAVFDALSVGTTRTLQQDVSYGLRQLVDVALKALSPGINDPTTAQDAIFHAASLLGEVLHRDPPARERHGEDGRSLLLPHQPTHDDLVALTFDETRRAAAPHPTVAVYILEAIELLCESLDGAGLERRSPALRKQAALTVAGCAQADLLPADLDLVQRAYDKRFR